MYSVYILADNSKVFGPSDLAACMMYMLKYNIPMYIKEDK